MDICPNVCQDQLSKKHLFLFQYLSWFLSLVRHSRLSRMPKVSQYLANFSGVFLNSIPPLLCKNPNSIPPPTKSMIWRDVPIRSPNYRWFSEWHSIWSLQARSSRLHPARYIFRIIEHRNLCNTATKMTTTSFDTVALQIPSPTIHAFGERFWRRGSKTRLVAVQVKWKRVRVPSAWFEIPSLDELSKHSKAPITRSTGERVSNYTPNRVTALFAIITSLQ